MLRDRLLLGIFIGLLGLLPFVLPGAAGAIFFILLSTIFIGMVLAEFYRLGSHFGLPAYSGWGVAVGCFWMFSSGIILYLLSDCRHWVLYSLGPAMPAAFLLLLLLRSQREADRKTAVTSIIISFAGVCFVLYTLGILPGIYFRNDWELPVSGRIAALYMIVVTKMADVGGYTVGMLTSRRAGGNHKMLPSLSPGKSWEGFFGGLGAGAAAAIAFTWPRQALFGPGGWPEEFLKAALFGLGCAIFGLLGDILASLLKRAADKKDSGCIPGLGGALDIFDSLIFVIPLFYVYLRLSYGG